jgi:hypothetical protein
MGGFFNGGIERLVYDWPVRDRLGVGRTATVYTTTAWTINGLYSRLRPRGVLSTATLGELLGVLRVSAWTCYRLCRFLSVLK